MGEYLSYVMITASLHTVFNVTAHRQNASVGYTQSEHLAALFVTQKYHAKLFYRVKPFARIIRKNVTPLQNWKPFSLPKCQGSWVASIAANKASQTCRV